MPMTLYERLYNDIYGADAYNRYKLSRVYATERDREFMVPDADKYINGGITKYQEAVARAKQYYLGSEDPGSVENRIQVADMLSQLYPDISFNEAFNQAENYMYYATGYHTDINSYWEHLNNVFRSTGSGMMAGIRAALLYVSGGLTGFGPNWQEEKQKVLNDINTTYAMNYVADDERFNDNLLKEMGTSIAALAPSMLASMGMTAAGGLLSAVTGGAALPILGATAGKAGSFLGNMMRFASMGSRYALFGMMDAGGTMIEMANAGFSDDVVLGTGLGMMIASGALEAGGDPLLNMAIKPFTALAKAFGKKEASKLVSGSVKQTIRRYIAEIPKAQLKSVAAESSTEVLQEFSSMFGYNLALNIEKSRGRIPLSVQGYTAEDFANALKETARQTALGTFGFSLVPGLANFLGSYAGGNIRQQINASQYTKSEGADHVTSTKNIDLRNVSIPENFNADTMNSFKAEPINVINIDGRYYPVNVTAEQAYALKNSSRVYTKEISRSSSSALREDIDTDIADFGNKATLKTINDTILTGLRNDAVSGFSYHDSEMRVLPDSDGASYVSVVPSIEGMSPIIIPIDPNSNRTSEQLQADIFGKTFTKRTEDTAGNESQTVSDILSEISINENPDADNTEAGIINEAAVPSQSAIDEAESVINRISERTSADTQNNADTQTAQETIETQPIRNDMERRSMVSAAINEAANKWEEIKNDLSGDRKHDIDSLSSYFEDYLDKIVPAEGKTRNKAARTIARASAEIAYGFASASGMPVQDYFRNLKAFVDNQTENFEGVQTDNNLGWFERIKDTAEYYINVFRGAYPTTLSHELSHHFLSTITESAPAYGLITESYASEFAADNNSIGTNVQEAFAKDLERYIFHRQSSNAKLNGLFDQLYKIIQSMYKTFKAYYGERLDDDKAAFFDVIFDNDSAEVDSSTDARITRAEKTDAPISETIDRMIPEEGKRALPIENTEESTTNDSQVNETITDVQENIEQRTEPTEGIDNQIEKPEKKTSNKTSISKESIRKSDNKSISETAESISDETLDKAIDAADKVDDKAIEMASESVQYDTAPTAPDTDKPVYSEARNETLPESETNERTEISEIPQSIDEIQQGDKPKKVKKTEPVYTIENTGNFEFGETDLRSILSILSKKTKKLGRIIPAQIKEITNGNIPEYIKGINDTLRANSVVKIISMATSSTMYEQLSNLFGVPIDANSVEVFTGSDGSIIYKLKADIRTVEQNGKTVSKLIPKADHDRWYTIPFSNPDTGEGVIERLEDLDAMRLIKNEITSEAERESNASRQEKYQSEKSKEERIAIAEKEARDEAEKEVDERIARGAKIDRDAVVETEYARILDEKMDKINESYEGEFDEDDTEGFDDTPILKKGFIGYSNSSVYSILLADGYSYQAEIRGMKGSQNIFFATDTVAANERFDMEYALDFIMNRPNSELFNAYSNFLKLVDDTKKKAEKEFNNNEENINSEYDIREEELQRYINEAVLLATGCTEPDASGIDLFRSWLMNSDEFGLSHEFDDIRNGSRRADFENIMDYVASFLIYADKSYNRIAKKLRMGVSNKNYFSNAENMLLDMFSRMQAKATRKTINAFVASLENNSAKESARKIFGSLKKNSTDSYSSTDIINVINAMVDENGNVANVMINTDETYTSPLIELCNYYSRDVNENTPQNASSRMFAPEEYISVSERILETVQPDVADADTVQLHSIIRNLINLFRKNNMSISTIFGKHTTPEFAEALLISINEKIRQKNAEIEKMHTVNDDMSREITTLRSEMKVLENSKKKIESAIERYSGKELEEEIKRLRKENRHLDSILEKAGGADSIDQLNRRVSYLERRVNELTEQRNQREKQLLREIEILKNSPEMKTAEDIQKAKNEIIGALDRSIRKTDARVGQNLSRIFYQLRNSDHLDMSLIENQKNYGDRYRNLRQYLIDNKIIDNSGKVLRKFDSLNLVEIGELSDVMLDISKTSRKAMLERRRETDQKWRARADKIIMALPKISRMMKENDYTSTQIDKLMHDLRDYIAPGSATDTKPGKLRTIASSFLQIETQLRAISPELHALLYGGYIDGEYISDNLNTAYNQRQRNTIDRKKRVADLYEKAFHIKASNIDIMYERIFNDKAREIGQITVEEFAEKYGISSWGYIQEDSSGKYVPVVNEKISEEFQPIAYMILKNQADFKNVEKKTKGKKATKRYDPANDLADASRRYKDRLYGTSEGSLYTTQQIMGIYINAQQSDKKPLNRMLRNGSGKTNNLSIGQILKVFDIMHSEEMESYKTFADGLQEIVGEKYADMAEIVYREENRILPMINKYFPMISNHTENEDIAILSSDGEFRKKSNKVKDDFIHDRTDTHQDPLNLDAVSIGIRAIEAQENFLAFKEITDRYNKMFSPDSNMSTAFGKVYGDKGKLLMDNMRTYINRIIDTDRQAPDDVNNFLTKLRHNMVVSVLWGNVSSMLQQFPTIVLGIRYAGFRKTFEWLFRYMRNPKEMQEMIYRLSPQMEARMMQETADYRAYTMNRHASNNLYNLVKQSNASNIYLSSHEILEKVRRAGLKPMEMLDRSIANSMWLAINEKYTEDNLQSLIDNGMTPEQASQAVADMATQTVMSIQTSQQAKDNALAYTGDNQLLKQFLLFTSQLNKQFNMMYGDVNDVWETYLNERDIGKEGSLKRTLSKSLDEGFISNIAMTGLVLGLASAAASAISGKMFSDDDDDDEWYDNILDVMKSTATESLNMIPGGNYLADIIDGTIYQDLGLVGSLINLKKVAKKDAADRTPHQMSRAVVNTANEISQIFGLPIISDARKIYNGFTDSEMVFNYGEIINSATGDFVRRIAN